jgi:hypothetical protein
MGCVSNRRKGEGLSSMVAEVRVGALIALADLALFRPVVEQGQASEEAARRLGDSRNRSLVRVRLGRQREHRTMTQRATLLGRAIQGSVGT